MDCQLRRWLVGALLVGFLTTGCAKAPATYVTEHGLGPDKWATAWLLTGRVDPGAKLQVVPIGKPLPKGIPFDVPQASVLRRGTLTAFEVAAQANHLTDPDTARFGRIVHDIEIGAWGAASDPDSPTVEQAFRALQLRYGRDTTTPPCYVEFFGNLSGAIANARAAKGRLRVEDLDTDCDNIATKPSPGQIVAEVPIDLLLSEMKRGKTVIFVDVREADEFAEAHIPGAMNAPIREKDTAYSRVGKADYVVSYCIKDFRGFEMAKALKDAGIQSSVILNPYGIRGWVEEGLPTVGSEALTQEAGLEKLKQCMSDPDLCKSTAKPAH